MDQDEDEFYCLNCGLTVLTFGYLIEHFKEGHTTLRNHRYGFTSRVFVNGNTLVLGNTTEDGNIQFSILPTNWLGF